MEGPEQQRIRRVVEPPFRPRDVEERTQGMIPKLAHELIDGFRERGSCDLFTEFADPMSVQALRFVLGLDEVRWQDILRWNQGLMPGPANFEGTPRSRSRRIARARSSGRRSKPSSTAWSASAMVPCSGGCSDAMGTTP